MFIESSSTTNPTLFEWQKAQKSCTSEQASEIESERRFVKVTFSQITGDINGSFDSTSRLSVAKPKLSEY